MQEIIAAKVRAQKWGKPSASKRGRDPRWPFVPVIDHSGGMRQRTEQIRGAAFATREEAVAFAVKTIEFRRESMAKRLADPRMRALRRQHGLPEDI